VLTDHFSDFHRRHHRGEYLAWVLEEEAAMVKVDDGEYELSPAEIRELLESEAQERFGTNWADAVTRYERGEIDSGDIGDLLIIADLLDEPIPA